MQPQVPSALMLSPNDHGHLQKNPRCSRTDNVIWTYKISTTISETQGVTMEYFCGLLPRCRCRTKDIKHYIRGLPKSKFHEMYV